MQGKKTFKYRAYANQEAIKNASRWLFLCRKLYNLCLEERIRAFKETGKSPSRFGQIKQLPAFKFAFPEYQQVGSQVLQDVIERLDKTYQAFFRRIKAGEKAGFPRFKSEHSYHSFTLKQAGWKLTGKYLKINKVGTFKLKLSRPIQGNIKTVTISHSSTDRWYASFSCEGIPYELLAPTGNEVGIDVGCESFLTTSNGDKIENPRFFKKAFQVLKMRQQRLSRRKKGSKRRAKARLLVAKAHEKVSNQRRDFHFKMANQLLNENDVIYHEDMPAFLSFRILNRSMRDVAWFGFFDILSFKAEYAGRKVVRVPAKDTSQLCSRCGAKVPKDLSIRIHSCPSCSLTIDRDLNAALNILRVGQTLQAFPAHSSP